MKRNRAKAAAERERLVDARILSRIQNFSGVLLKSPTELLTYIKDKKKLNVVTQANATLLGSYLHRKGFAKGKGRQKRRYEVALTM